MDQKKRRLIIHLDINNTLVMKDKSQNQSLEYTVIPIQLNLIIAKECWGVLIEKQDSKLWKLSHNTLSFIRPAPDLISYKEFADTLYPQKSEQEQPDFSRRQIINRQHLESYFKLISEFTLAGKPGYKFKSLFDKMIRCLSLPKAICQDYELYRAEQEKEDQQFQDQEQRPDQEQKELIKKLFKEGRANIVPSFYRLIQELKKSKREFSFVFRSFGELDEVVQEFNLFCRGNHPMFNGKHGTPRLRFDGQNKTKDFRVDNSNLGYITRTPFNSFVLGSVQKHPQQEDPQDYHSGAIDEGFVHVFKDFPSIHVAIQDKLHSIASMGITDDYYYWNSNGQTGQYGKLLLIDQSDYSTHHIFFDDQIGFQEPEIIDVRDVVTGESLPFEKSWAKYIWKVDPYRAIVQSDYFFKALLQCEDQRTQEIMKLESGIISQEEVMVEQESEWDKLQRADSQEYLNRTIIPVLLPGMKMIDLIRPDDPVSFLALYCLKNQHLVKLPPIVNSQVWKIWRK